MEFSINGRVVNIDGSRKYIFPSDIFVKIFEGFAVIVSPSNGNWIVLDSQIQIDMFKLLLKGDSIDQVLKVYPTYSDDMNKVLEQVEGRLFEHSFIPDEDGFSLRIYLTNNCNLRCKHCFVFAANAFENELSMDEINKLIYRCNESGCNKIILTGGEVTMRQDFGSIVKYSHDLGMYVQVLSNGTLWSLSQIEELSNYIDEIQISIDGYNEESMSRIRGAGVFEKALKTVDNFMKIGETFVNIIVTPMVDDLEKNYIKYRDFARSLIKKYTEQKFLIYFQSELIDGRNIKADVGRNKKLKQLVHELHEELYENSELTTFIMHHRHHRLHLNCGYGGLTVDSVGNLFFCSRIYELKSYGNIHHDNFDDILKLRKKIRQLTYVDNLYPCKECELRYICGGGCRINNFPAAININTSEPRNAHEIHRINKCEEKDNLYRLMIESADFLLE